MGQSLLLIDINNQIHRSYHALPKKRFISPDGQPVNAVYGICRFLAKLITEYQNTNTSVAVVFDHGSSFRKKIYPDYKMNRPKLSDDFLTQQKIIKQAIVKFGLSVISKPEYEADDLIASYAKQAQKLNIPVTIISNDKDLLQLVNDNNQIYDCSKNKTYDPQAVYQKMQVYPHQIRDLLALVGDTSDNISGIPGIGPSTAAELLNTYGDIDNLLQHLPQLPIKLSNKINQYAHTLLLSRQLITLQSDLILDVAVEELPKLTLVNAQELYDFCQHYGFISIIKQLQLSPADKSANNAS